MILWASNYYSVAPFEKVDAYWRPKLLLKTTPKLVYPECYTRVFEGDHAAQKV